MAASRKPVASKKRKVSDDLLQHQQQQPAPVKKKSPLFNQPQNYYAPPSISSMTKDELSEWRKEQRRKRNRESAAASRNKTRVRIDELEGEVEKWKRMYHDMEMKMRCMERHIQFLTKMSMSTGPTQGQQPSVVAPTPPHQALPEPTVVSHPNSPPLSPRSHDSMPVVPNAVTSFMPPPPAYSPHTSANLFPPLLSEPKDCTAVETQEAAPAVVPEESKKHINQISRQAVKITGANFDSSKDNLKQEQLSALPTCSTLAKTKEAGEKVGTVVSISGALEDMPVEAAAVVTQPLDQVTQEAALPTIESSSPESSDDDGDFLDLLVDTLEGDFDPDLLI